MALISSDTSSLAWTLGFVALGSTLLVNGTMECLQKFSQLGNLSLKKVHHSFSESSPSLWKYVLFIIVSTSFNKILDFILLFCVSINFLLFFPVFGRAAFRNGRVFSGPRRTGCRRFAGACRGCPRCRQSRFLRFCRISAACFSICRPCRPIATVIRYAYKRFGDTGITFLSKQYCNISCVSPAYLTIVS